MADFRLRVGIGDDDAKFFKLFDLASDNRPELRDVKIEVIDYHIQIQGETPVVVYPDGTRQDAISAITRDRLHLLYLDYYLGASKDAPTGYDLAKKLKRLNPRLKTVSTSHYGPQQEGIVKKLAICLKGRNRRIFVDTLDKDPEIFRKKLAPQIRRYAFKRLNIGIAGYSDITDGLVPAYLPADEVETVKVFSSTVPAKDISNIFVEADHHEKLVTTNSLDELLDDIHLLVIATSSRRGRDIVKIKVSPDRHELFQGEVAKLSQIYLGVLKRKYDGAIFVITNPVPHNQELGLRLEQLFAEQNPQDSYYNRGHPDYDPTNSLQYKIASALQPDSSRLINALKEEKTIGPDGLEELKQSGMSFINVHGAPRVLCEERLYRKYEKGIKRAERKSVLRGRTVQKKAAKWEKRFHMPQATNGLPLIKRLARFKQFTGSHHIHVDSQDIPDYHGEHFSGCIAIPILTSWVNGKIQFRPNLPAVLEINADLFHKIADPMLIEQNIHINDALGL